MANLSFISFYSVKGKADEKNHITITFNYKLEKVYNATKFTLVNSEDRWIPNYSEENYYIEGKAINVGNRRDIDFFFDPFGEQSTKVKFVITQKLQAKMAGKRLIDEQQYYLENGEEAYMKYTKNEALKRRVKGYP